MRHHVAPLAFKPSRLNGLSERLVASHYENNYGGAVQRLNAIEHQVADLDPATAQGFLINGLKREQLIAANSMILHEAYFDGLGGSGGDADGILAEAMERDFGTVSRWRREFAAMGKALGGGSGWVLLTLSDRDGRLSNQWAADHTHTLADGRVILALDMYEHAYHLDFGADAGAYVDAFMRNVHWERVGARYDRVKLAYEAGTAAPQPSAVPILGTVRLRAMLAEGAPITILDTRLPEDFEAAADTLPTARHRDPRSVDDWAADVPRDRPAALYCTYGLNWSRDTAAILRQRHGVDAHVLSGGIAAWHAMGAPTAPKG